MTIISSADLPALFENHADRVYRLAYGLLRDEDQAEDVVQMVFLKILQQPESFGGRSNFTTWLYRVVYNTTLDLLRRQKEMVEIPDETTVEDGVPMPSIFVEWQSPETTLLTAEGGQYLDAAIASLPPALRAVFLLRDVEELSGEETAAALGIEIGNVKVRLHRARLLLRERLAAYFAEVKP